MTVLDHSAYIAYLHSVFQTFPRDTRLKVSQETFKPADFEAWKASIRVIVGLVDWLMISIISFRFIMNSIVLGYVSNVSRSQDLSRKKIKFFCIIDNAEINKITTPETVFGEVDRMVYLLPKLDFPTYWSGYVKGSDSIANSRLIVFYEVYVH